MKKKNGNLTSSNFLKPFKTLIRGLAYAPYADLLWVETSTPDLDEARDFAAAIHAQFPGKLLAYNCSPSFNWRRAMDEAKIATFQKELGALGYRFQFVTLAGFHSLNHGMFELAKAYGARGMAAYSELQTVRNRLFEFSPPSFFFFFGFLRLWVLSPLSFLPFLLTPFLSPPPKKNSKRKRKPFVGRVRLRGSRLHRDQAPARGRHGLLRRRVDGRERRRFVDARAQGLDRGGAVPLGIAPLSWLFGLCFLLESTIERHRNESFFIGKKGGERRGRERKNLYVFSF